MANELEGKTVAFLSADGVEQVELTKPRSAIESAGAQTHLIGLETGEIQGLNHLDKADKFQVDKAVADASATDYDALVLPGGVANGDFVRSNPQAVEFVKSFFEAGKPVSGICHGLWVLVEGDLVKGRTLTSWPSLQTDIRNAGGTWVDEEVVVDEGLTTSRNPDDLPAFISKTIEEISEGKHEEQATKTEEALSS